MASRRPGSDRAAQNAQTLKALIKLEGNKVCADCKKNKHPRWASWNLGVFVCIRCSGVHRGMGTHVSRVKSVDLDSWTDEQLQSILKWGNTRANKYWEARLAPGHQPSEAKLENFIRTKYESKRWVMDGPMPDPSTLDVDDDVPLNIVQEKAKIERSASQRLASPEKAQAQAQAQAQRRLGAAPTAPAVDLFGDIVEPPARPTAGNVPDAGTKPTPTRTGPLSSKPAPKSQDALLNLDFFGASPSATAGQSNTASKPTPTANTRGDLKNSILSLYASAPPKPAATQSTHDQQAAQPKDAFGGLTDAFGGLSFPSSAPAKSQPSQSPPPTASVGATRTASIAGGLGGVGSTVSAKGVPAAPQMTSAVSPLSGGSFFDAFPTPTPTPTQPPAPQPASIAQKPSNNLDFSFTQRAVTASPPAPQPGPTPTPFGVPATSASASASASTAVRSKPAASIPADLFNDDDFGGWSSSPATSAAPTSATAPAPAPAPAAVAKVASSTSTSNDFNSAFNLSAAPPAAQAAASPPRPTAAVHTTTNALFDPWSSANVESSPWGAPEPVTTTTASKAPAPSVDLGKVPSRITPNDITGGWGAPISGATSKSTAQPRVTADEDFGAWTSDSTPTTVATGNPTKAGGAFGGASDPFDNPWG